MASLLDKVQTLISANLHYLVDQALKQNSIAVINQYIREVEDNLEDLSEATATVGGQVKTLRRKQEEYQARAADLDRNIDRFLQEGREDLARAAQSKLNSTQRLVDTYTQQLEQMEREYQSLLDARLKLEAKLTTIKQEREQLEALLELAKSKEITVKTIKSLDDLSGVGDADVARIADSIRARLDRASAESEMRAASLDNRWTRSWIAQSWTANWRPARPGWDWAAAPVKHNPVNRSAEMASLLDKIRVLVSADLNRMVDRALRTNETAVFQHHVRQLQVMQDELIGQLASVRAELTRLRRKSDEQQALLVKQDQEVDALLQAGLQEDALAAQDRLNQTRLAAAHLVAQLETLEAQYAQMVEVQAQVTARVGALQQRAPEVDSLVGMARAKELTATTMAVAG